MRAVEEDKNWALVVFLFTKQSKQDSLWIKILIARIETGEPYLLFIDILMMLILYQLGMVACKDV